MMWTYEHMRGHPEGSLAYLICWWVLWPMVKLRCSWGWHFWERTRMDGEPCWYCKGCASFKRG
jgi:hypothetical protein